MRDPARIDRICELLRAAWHESPDQRLGQFVYNLLIPSRPERCQRKPDDCPLREPETVRTVYTCSTNSPPPSA